MLNRIHEDCSPRILAHCAWGYSTVCLERGAVGLPTTLSNPYLNSGLACNIRCGYAFPIVARGSCHVLPGLTSASWECKILAGKHDQYCVLWIWYAI